MNGPNMNRPEMSSPIGNGPTANIPAANRRPAGGPIRVRHEYTGKHRRDSGPGSFNPWSRAEPDGRPKPGTGPAPEWWPWSDAG